MKQSETPETPETVLKSDVKPFIMSEITVSTGIETL